MRKPTHLDLFSGVGGFTLAFQRAGFKTVAFSEIEKFPCKVLAKRWSEIPNLGDVSEITEEDLRTLGEIDIVTFGSPCQDWSVAGKRLGLEGHRSSLFHEAIRIIRIVRPRFGVFENVPGLFSSAKRWDFAAVLDEMAESGAMDIAWSVLDAQWFGVPQRRRRIFLVADFRGERAGEILSISEGVCRDPAPSREAGQEATTRATPSVEATLGGGCGSSLQGDGSDNLVPEVAGGLTTRYGKGVNTTADDGAIVPVVAPESRSNYHSDHDGDEGRLITHALTSEGHDASEDGTGRGTPIVGFYANSGYKEDPVSGASAPLKGGKENAGQAAVAFAENQRAEVRTSEIHPQSTVGGGKPGQGYPAVAFGPGGNRDTGFARRANPSGSGDRGSGGLNTTQVISGMAVRKLTPVECERLQGFPDGWTDTPGGSDSGRYRAMGNAVAVPVVEWVAKRMAGEINQLPPGSCRVL